MAKYLIEASYTQEGLKGLLKEGGSARRAAVETTARGLGGSVESFYYVFGDDDVVAVIDMPDHVSAAALSLGVGAAGGVTASLRVLIPAEDIDAAVRKTVEYRAPGR